MNNNNNIPILVLLAFIAVVCSAWLGAIWVEVKQVNRYLDSIKDYTMYIRYNCTNQ